MKFSEQLEMIGACEEAIEWVEENNYTLKEAWQKCERGDWMLWFAAKQGVNLRRLVLAKSRCAKLVKHLMKDKRSRSAIEVAERFGLGQATHKELDAADVAATNAAAAFAAAAGAVDATDAAAANAANTAADAYATAANAAAYANAAYAYATDAYVTAADDIQEEILKKCADICREILTDEVL